MALIQFQDSAWQEEARGEKRPYEECEDTEPRLEVGVIHLSYCLLAKEISSKEISPGYHNLYMRIKNKKKQKTHTKNCNLKQVSVFTKNNADQLSD